VFDTFVPADEVLGILHIDIGIVGKFIFLQLVPALADIDLAVGQPGALEDVVFDREGECTVVLIIAGLPYREGHRIGDAVTAHTAVERAVIARHHTVTDDGVPDDLIDGEVDLILPVPDVAFVNEEAAIIMVPIISCVLTEVAYLAA